MATVELARWVEEYNNSFTDLSIHYTDPSGMAAEETDSHLTSISQTIQQRPRPHIDRRELRSIGEWKTGGRRIDHYLTSNTAEKVIEVTEAAFAQNVDDVDRIRTLTELRGVGVPVASSILTMYDPLSFAVIDFRALRALAAVHPFLTNTSNYSVYASFIRCLLDYLTDPRIYREYMSMVRSIAEEQNLSTREVDMALWAYDRENAQFTSSIAST